MLSKQAQIEALHRDMHDKLFRYRQHNAAGILAPVSVEDFEKALKLVREQERLIS